MNSKVVKYSTFLIVLGIIVGGLLAVVNSFTSTAIAARQKEEVANLLQTKFNYAQYSIDKLSDYTDVNETIQAIYYAFDETGVLQAVIYKTVAQGYAGDVVSLVGIKVDGTFDNAFMIEGSKETKDKAEKVKNWDYQIAGDPVEFYTITSPSPKYTSGAVEKGIAAASEHFRSIQSQLGGIKNE